MFPGKFFMAESAFPSSQDHPPVPDAPRFHRLSLVVHRFLTWFQTHEALESVKVTAIALLAFEKIPFSVRVKHHIKIVTVGVNDLVTDEVGFVIENIPYADLGHGVFELKRTDPTVLEFLKLVASPENATELEVEYRALVSKISMYMDAGFEPCSIIHDIGPLV